MNQEHLAILKKGVDAWNQWRFVNFLITPNLSGADLRLAYLSNADLGEADLSGGDLRGAYLSGAHLRGADLHEADLHEADLRGADLRRADLRAAYLSGTDLGQADLTEAKVGWTTFGNLDLRTVKGLEQVKHNGPSTIGIDTIYLSGGDIPEIFLRGTGVPDNFIAYIGSLVAKPIEFYSLFISYSTKDQEFADRLYADLQAKNVRCWFAPHDIRGGKQIHEQIDEAIRIHDKLLILSEASMNSDWVSEEFARARKRERREGRRMLFPISIVPYEDAVRDWECFDADSGTDSAREIRKFYIPDFTRWKDHDSYQQAFTRLLRDLKQEAS